MPEKRSADLELEAVSDRLEEIRDALDIIAERLKTRGSVTMKDIEVIAELRREKKLTDA